MDDLFGALLTGIAIFGSSILIGVILYFLFKDPIKGIIRKND